MGPYFANRRRMIIKPFFRVLVYLFLLSFSSAWGASGETDVLLLQEPSVEATRVAVDTDSLTLNYDPKELDSKVLDRNLDIQSLKRQVPSESTFHSLSPEEQQKFLIKKNLFLEKVETFLEWLHLGKKAQETTLKKIEDIFYSRARQIAKANAYGGTVLLHTHLGFGLSQRLLARMQKAIGSEGNFTGRGGFIVMLGLGLSLTKVEIQGQVRWVFEAFANYGRLIKVRSFLAEVGVGIGAYAHGQHRKEFLDFENLLRVQVQGAAGQIRENSRMLQAGQSFTLAMPPLAGMAMLYTMRERRWSLFKLSWVSTGGAVMCRQVFN